MSKILLKAPRTGAHSSPFEDIFGKTSVSRWLGATPRLHGLECTHYVGALGSFKQKWRRRRFVHMESFRLCSTLPCPHQVESIKHWPRLC
eukprot:scaffold614_cov378-Pavlova_lutheri.AAC.13